MGEEQFLRLFPGSGGLPLLPDRRPRTCAASPMAAALAGDRREGAAAVWRRRGRAPPNGSTAFHRVENTYLSTFQALGGLGLLLGTIGLAAVMFRNVLERRRELALLRAVGYDRAPRPLMIVAETRLPAPRPGLAQGLCALIAVIPAWLSRGGSGPGVGTRPAARRRSPWPASCPPRSRPRPAVSGRLLEALRAE